MIFTFLIASSVLFNTGPKVLKFPSEYSHEELVDRSSEYLLKKRLKVHNIIRFHKETKKKSETILPTTVVLFSDSELVADLVSCDQKIGEAMPFSVLIWEDASGKSWIGFVDPLTHRESYDLSNCLKQLDKMRIILTQMCVTVSQ